MRPEGLKTKIFLDGGDPNQTKEIIRILGFLDGQTTNPTLIGKNPEARKQIQGGKKFSGQELLAFYKHVVGEISSLMPQGSVSVEVYADTQSRAEDMLRQGKEMFSWIPNGHVKFPTSAEGLKAAQRALSEGLRVNMTLCFSQEQAAAVYAATRGAKRGDVFVSPFIGRLDDRGENGMQLIENIIEMYKKGDGHVLVLTASVRTIDHLLYAFKLGSDIVTAPFPILKEWGERGMPMPDKEFRYWLPDLKHMLYKEIDLSKNWDRYDIAHELTTKGMEQFSADWNAMIG
ncbi:MAG TPA: transaldolase family protein [Syntrophorhabdaceae bacterium]|jgi:transaldolase